MNDVEFDEFLAVCAQRLAAKQALIMAEVADFASLSWQLDAGVSELILRDGQGPRVRFAVTPIGTFAAAQESWKWSWANSKLPQAARTRAEALKGLEAITDYTCFAEMDAFAVDEGMAWELAAAAVDCLQADGCYRARNRDTWLFLALYREQ